MQVVGTGDFVHPAWLKELQERLEPAEAGFFKLKPDYDREARKGLPLACRGDVRFILSCEISNIYKRLDKVRKVHNVIFAPSFAAAERIQSRLSSIGNIHSDGRPILGLDSHDLLEIVLESDPFSYLVPAHIWTPWFSVFGSQSGFDHIEDCFGDLTKHVFALETGLSSDPPMNWRLGQLDSFALVSNSDAHSAAKLGRESTIYNTDFSYQGIYRALAGSHQDGLEGTVEFFPEEGKYHYDGHRLCRKRMHPKETKQADGVCPVCGKPVTVGVMSRVEDLADFPEGRKSPRWRPYHSLIPLAEIIGEAKDVAPGSQTVQKIFMDILGRLGNEMYVLREAPLKDIEKIGGSLLAECVRRVRSGTVSIAAGYDGEYGTISLLSQKERDGQDNQMTLF